jgi:hypothetical protein
VLSLSVFGLATAVQAALPDLENQQGAVLVTGGGLASYDPNPDRMAVEWGAQRLAIGKQRAAVSARSIGSGRVGGLA